MKKSSIIILSMFLVFSMLASCAMIPTEGGITAGTEKTDATTAAPASDIPNFNPTGYPIVKEPIKLKMYNQMRPDSPYNNEMSFFKAMKGLTNIDFECANIPNSEYQTKLSLSLAAGEMYDLYMSMGPDYNNHIVNYGILGGMFFDYSDLIDDYMPNLLSWQDEYPKLLKYVTQLNGGIYSFPRLLASAGDTQATLSVRLDRMNEAGITKLPETINEFYEMCKAIKEYNTNDPDFNVIVMNKNDIGFFAAFQASILPAFGDYISGSWQVDKNNKVFFNGVTDQAYRYFEFVYKLYEEKILFNEVFTLDSAANTAMHKADKTAVATSFTMLTADNFESGKMDFTLLGPLTSEYSSEKKIQSVPGIQDVGVVISSKSKHKEALLRWLDIHYAKEDVIPGLNHLSPWLGIRGETWDYTDETKEYYALKTPADWSLSATEFIYRNCGHSTLYMNNMESIMVGSSPGLEVKIRDSIKRIFPYQKPNFPGESLRYTNAEFEEYTTLWSDIKNYVIQMNAKFIIGEEPLSNFSKYVETLNSMGLPRLTEIIQKAYDRWNSD